MAERTRFFHAYIIILVMSLFIAGCGSGSGGGGASGGNFFAVTDGAVDFNDAAFWSTLPNRDMLLSGGEMSGTVTCVNCHAVSGSAIRVAKPDSWATFANVDGNISWLYGPHGNINGLPSFGMLQGCTTACHDPLGDGMWLSGNFAKTGINIIGNVNRPIVGCEACHGGGEEHYGVGPLPVVRPNAVRCGRCHNASLYSPNYLSHLDYQPEAGGIFEEYRTSRHANSIEESNLVSGSQIDVQGRCSRCHTDEGAQAYIRLANGTESYTDLRNALGSASDISNAAVVQCRTCHDKHNPYTLLGQKAVFWGSSSGWANVFKTCTLCHQLLKSDSTRNSEAYHDPSVSKYGDPAEIITDTHYDDPNTDAIEGYVVNPYSAHDPLSGNTNSGTCIDCHNQHNAWTTINRQWARSAHGGFIMSDAGWTTAVTTAMAPAWTFYDFKLSSGGFDGNGYKACQRCHTSTGFRNLANNPTTYDANGDGLPDVLNTFVASGKQKEMLYCWACHTSNKGHLRNPGRFVLPAVATYIIPSGRSSWGTIGGSFICLNCHSGSETGAYLKTLNYASQISGKDFGAFNSHYLAAGGILYRTIGYEWKSMNYENNGFEHDKVGTFAPAGTGVNGPCVGCHMRNSESHLLLPVRRDPGGAISEITSAQTCGACHGFTTFAVDTTKLNNLEAGYAAAIDALKAIMASKGIYYSKTDYPYFWTSGFTAKYSSWPNTDTLGAAFNLNLLVREPGGYVHNDLYVKRLIYDSIDFMYDGNINGDVTIAINSLSWTTPQKAAALSYLNNGTRP